TLNSPSKTRTQNPEIDSGIIQWGTPEVTTTTTVSDSSAMDWSAPVNRAEEELVLDWGGNDEDPDTEDSSDQGLSMKPTRSDSDAEGKWTYHH
ncbi:Dmxl2_0 protein, partial [Gryllus bimaculatus]